MIAQMFNYREWVSETNPDKLSEELEKSLLISGFTIINKIEHYFKPYGYTSIYLLSESHLAVHTFPEHGKTYLELSSCIKEPFEKFLKTYKLPKTA